MTVRELNRFLIVLLAYLMTGCLAVVASDDQKSSRSRDIQFTASDFYRSNGYPFSQFVESDGWVFLSGAIGNVPGSGLAPGGIEPETRQTMKNIQSTLEIAGLGMGNIVKCTVMLADMSEWSTFNQVYKEFFKSNYPARSAFGANGLALEARVEVECIARR